MRAEDIDRLGALIDKKSWQAFDRLYQGGKTVYESLEILLNKLGNQERSLVLDILEDYLIVREYSEYTRELLQRISSTVASKRLLFSPIKDFKSDRPKSGDALIYEIHTLRGVISEKRVCVVDDPRNPKCQEQGVYHIAVDDFIGSGNQFTKMVNELKEKDVNPNFQGICAIVIQSEARQILEDSGYNVFSCVERHKAIGNPNGRFQDNIASAYELYDSIEGRIACPSNYRRGYRQSEASVSMKATPNNTLPIFWYQGKDRWPAPFPRP